MRVKTELIHSLEVTKEDKAIMEKMGNFFEELVPQLDNTFFFKGKEGTVYNIDNLYYVMNFLDDFNDYMETFKW